MIKINCDLHAHTHLSSCADSTATIPYYVKKAKELGLNTVGITDHLWDTAIPFSDAMRHSKTAGPGGDGPIRWYAVQNLPHVLQIREELASMVTGGVRFLVGAEVEYCQGYGSAIAEDNVGLLDFLIVPISHTHMMMPSDYYFPYERHARFMIDAFFELCACPLARYVTAVAHPFDAVAAPYDNRFVMEKISDAQYAECFCAAREAGIAMEINAASLRGDTGAEMQKDEAFRMLSIAKSCGVRFTFGSDAHSEGGHDTFFRAGIMADLLALSSTDILEVS
jgi:HisJ family histidinol phosphate phosphatase